MSPFKLSSPLRRDPPRPGLKARAATLKAAAARVIRGKAEDAEIDQGRRSLIAGSFAAALPLPALAVTARPHPDAALLDADDAFQRAHDAAQAADRVYVVAMRAVDAVRLRCPVDLKARRWEYELVNPPFCRSPFGGARFRWVPPREEEAGSPHWSNQAWTGELLRAALARAVPVLGRGGLTPYRIRRWKGLLSIADAFDAEVEAAETASGYRQARAARDAALAECERLRKAISVLVATTPEGMAALVRVIGEYGWKDSGGAWPNLLRSAANVSGVPLAAIEHERASTRHLRS